MTTPTRNDIIGIVQVTIPVTDLARSAAFYRDLLDLTYLREFGDGKDVTGCALADLDARYLISLRRRDTLRSGADADLRGEHPIVLQAASPEAAARILDRATALGIPSAGGTHADGTWLELPDPDGIALRIVHTPTLAEAFLGVTFTDDGGTEFYHHPMLDLPPAPVLGERLATGSGVVAEPASGVRAGLTR